MGQPEISLTAQRDGKPLDLNDLPGGLASLGLLGAQLTLNGEPVILSDRGGKVGWEYRGAQLEVDGDYPAVTLLEAIRSFVG